MALSLFKVDKVTGNLGLVVAAADVDSVVESGLDSRLLT
ncbi:hypothetical protein ENHYD8BJ_10045 [Enhydrobacter sp. 8BJ]|nr:hypothetical protein ENHYD8BJ_10045 [Enhydrobacter sp. 8BJ]